MVQNNVLISRQQPERKIKFNIIRNANSLIKYYKLSMNYHRFGLFF